MAAKLASQIADTAGVSMSPRSHRIVVAALILGAATSLALCVLLVARPFVLGVPEPGWHYSPAQVFSLRAFVLVVAATAPAVAFLFLPLRLLERHTVLVLCAWMFLALGVQGVLRSLALFGAERAFVSDMSNSFYTSARQYQPLDLLRSFETKRDTMPGHAQSNMPGKIMLIQLLQTISSRTDVLPWLVIAVSNLGALLMYRFVSQVFGSRETAFYSAVLYLFVPAKLFFFPLMNTVTPVFVLASACLLMHCLLAGSIASAALFGVSLYGLVFFDPLALSAGWLFAVMVLHALYRGQIGWRRLAAQAAIAALALIAISEIMRRVFEFDLPTVFRHLLGDAVGFNTVANRPYSLWIKGNILEFAFGLSPMQVVLFIAALIICFRAPGGMSAQLVSPLRIVSITLLATLITLDLLGVNRGEVMRLWIFLACLFQAPAAALCAAQPGRTAIATVVATNVFYTGIASAVMGFILP